MSGIQCIGVHHHRIQITCNIIDTLLGWLVVFSLDSCEHFVHSQSANLGAKQKSSDKYLCETKKNGLIKWNRPTVCDTLNQVVR